MTKEEALATLKASKEVFHLEVEEETEYFNGSIFVNYTYELEVEDNKVLHGVFSYED
jgi:hypothetical protein